MGVPYVGWTLGILGRDAYVGRTQGGQPWVGIAYVGRTQGGQPWVGVPYVMRTLGGQPWVGVPYVMRTQGGQPWVGIAYVGRTQGGQPWVGWGLLMLCEHAFIFIVIFSRKKTTSLNFYHEKGLFSFRATTTRVKNKISDIHD